jgi:integrase
MSTRRRANGEGSIYRRNSTGQWVAAITVSGTVPLVKRTRTAKTRAEANRLLRQLQAEVDEGPLLDDNRITIADWCHQWCDTIAPQNAIEATVADYYWTLDHYVLPHLGGYRLNELTPRHVAEFQNALIASGKAKGTVRHARSPLSAALNHAVRCSMIRTNPCTVVPQPKRDNATTRTKKSLTHDEARRLLDATSTAEPNLRAFIEFGLYRGPRRSEILGLKWTDIDADAEVIRIRRRLREERLRSKDGTYVVRLRAGKPKTPKSRRDLSLRGPIGATTRALRADQNRRRLAAGPDWADSGYLFTTTNGDPVYPSNMYRRYKELLATNNLPNISFHDLRRTWATLGMAAGIPIEQAQEALGHSRIETTKNIYVGAVPALARWAFDTFDDYLDAPRRPAGRHARDTEET